MSLDDELTAMINKISESREYKLGLPKCDLCNKVLSKQYAVCDDCAQSYINLLMAIQRADQAIADSFINGSDQNYSLGDLALKFNKLVIANKLMIESMGRIKWLAEFNQEIVNEVNLTLLGVSHTLSEGK